MAENLAENLKKSYRKYSFAQNYILRGMNSAEAYVAAGYSPRSTAAPTRLLHDPMVIGYMQRLLQEQQEKLSEVYRADKENIIRELVKIAFFDPRKVVRVENGKARIASSDEITNIEAAAIAGIKEGKHGIEVKFHDKLEAIDKLAKIFGLYVEKHEISGKDGQALNITFDIPRPNKDELKKIENNGQEMRDSQPKAICYTGSDTVTPPEQLPEEVIE